MGKGRERWKGRKNEVSKKGKRKEGRRDRTGNGEGSKKE